MVTFSVIKELIKPLAATQSDSVFINSCFRIMWWALCLIGFEFQTKKQSMPLALVIKPKAPSN